MCITANLLTKWNVIVINWPYMQLSDVYCIDLKFIALLSPSVMSDAWIYIHVYVYVQLIRAQEQSQQQKPCNSILLCELTMAFHVVDLILWIYRKIDKCIEFYANFTYPTDNEPQYFITQYIHFYWYPRNVSLPHTLWHFTFI